jgi:hypothetical protein
VKGKTKETRETGEAVDSRWSIVEKQSIVEKPEKLEKQGKGKGRPEVRRLKTRRPRLLTKVR